LGLFFKHKIKEYYRNLGVYKRRASKGLGHQTGHGKRVENRLRMREGRKPKEGEREGRRR